CGRHAKTWVEDGAPRCAVCGGPLRPDVVWFGEALPPAALNAAFHAAQNCEVFFSIGTSGLVEPAASLPWEALRARAVVVEINPNPTPLSDAATYTLPGAAGQVLPELLSLL
ncbi:MAG: NAD-dependent protein deacylase, partial [Anaerolineales bacterium]|nr:NAD-dependent protein deacylase [Anaerolineales bacterium]